MLRDTAQSEEVVPVPDEEAVAAPARQPRPLSTLRLLCRLFPHAGIGYRHFLFAIFMSLIFTCLEGVMILLLGPLIEQLLGGSRTASPLFGSIIGYFVPPETASAHQMIAFASGIFIVSTLKNLLGYFHSILTARWREGWFARIQRLLLRRYLGFGKLYFDKTHTGNIQTVLDDFVNSVSQGYGAIQSALSSVIFLILYFSILLYLSWQLTLLAALVFPLLSFSAKAVTKRVGVYSQKRVGLQVKVSELLMEILRGIPLIKLCHSEKRELRRYSELADYLIRTDLKIQDRLALLEPTQETIVQFFYLLLITAIGVLIHLGHLSAGVHYLIFILVLRRIMGNVGALIGLRTFLIEHASPLSRVSEVLDDQGKYYVLGGRRIFRGMKRSMEVHHLSFCYLEGYPVLKDVSFELRRNEMLALVGPSGAGKSTLVHLLLRYYPVARGQISIDDRDINDYSIDSLLDHFSFVSQDPTLFNASLRDNLTYGLWSAFTDEQLWGGLERASLKEMVVDLPNGMDTLIGERGVRLSGGEKQRLALARALLKTSDILVLDEATNSLDVNTERVVQEAITRTLRTQTSIVIAHRLHTVRNADRIVVLEGGSVHESGTFEDCLRRKGLFYEMYRNQSFIQ